MRVRLIISGCFVILFISSCLDQSGIYKNNHLGSRSLAKSMEHGVYVSHCALLPKISNCQLDSFSCWMESAWTLKYSLLRGNSINRLNFYNVYFKPVNSYDEVLVRENHEGKWRNTSVIIEPNLGFYFQLSKDISLESVEVKLVNKGEECLYSFVRNE